MPFTSSSAWSHCSASSMTHLQICEALTLSNRKPHRRDMRDLVVASQERMGRVQLVACSVIEAL